MLHFSHVQTLTKGLPTQVSYYLGGWKQSPAAIVVWPCSQTLGPGLSSTAHEGMVTRSEAQEGETSPQEKQATALLRRG